MRKTILALPILTLALTPALTSAGDMTESTITVVGDDSSDAGLNIYGIVESSKKCEKARTVEFYDKSKSGEVTVIDVDTTSDRGAFNVILTKGDPNSSLFVRVLKSTPGNTKCRAAKDFLTF
jgi:hypothetical protein